MRLLLNISDYSYPAPEKESEPFEIINGLLVSHTGRGVGKKAQVKLN